jgi:hypothetical protein
MTLDPYAPPKTDSVAPAGPRKKSFALRTSIVLAVAGVAAFWIPGAFVFTRHGENMSAGAEALLGVAAIASISAHLVGVGVVFAAPRGKRVAGVLANALPLLILAALMVLGTTIPEQA